MFKKNCFFNQFPVTELDADPISSDNRWSSRYVLGNTII